MPGHGNFATQDRPDICRPEYAPLDKTDSSGECEKRKCMRILMVCLGNICRSPIAEGVLKAKATAAGLDWIIESAGTEKYHIGKPPHQFSQSICSTHGIDISAQRARRFTPADLTGYDLVYAMADDVLTAIRKISGPKADYSHVQLFLDELEPGAGKSVPDPWYGDEAGYIGVYDMIDACCDAIIKNHGPATGHSA
jgi:protein-tyrosine phosphatase